MELYSIKLMVQDNNVAGSEQISVLVQSTDQSEDQSENQIQDQSVNLSTDSVFEESAQSQSDCVGAADVSILSADQIALKNRNKLLLHDDGERVR